MSWLLWLLACSTAPDFDAVGPGPFHEGEPSITSVEWGCELDDMEWTFEVETEQWTGAGWIRMAKSAAYSELHRLPSVEAAGDGSTDRLRLTLNVAQDWRAATSGRSTAWRCRDEGVLTYMITVYSTDGEAVTDCRTWGADTSMWTRITGAHDCQTQLEGTEPIGDTGE